MIINTFAPVIIPTLCRYEHFKRCVESLSRCTYAENTEIIIGLDYPPNEKYEEGYRMICDYLPQIKGFSEVTVIKHEKNLGAIGNLLFLKKYAANHYDRFIFTEDDNEFAPNFLAYINKGLEKYKDNPHVFSICGYNFPVNMSGYQNNNYCSFRFSAWGYGTMTERDIDLSISKVFHFVIIPHHFIKLLFTSPSLLLSVAYMLSKHEVHGDACFEIYNCINNWKSIFPSISKVRNWGHDGSGEHGMISPEDDPCFNQVIDTEVNFDFDEVEMKEVNWKPLYDYFHKPFCWYISRLFNKFRNKK